MNVIAPRQSRHVRGDGAVSDRRTRNGDIDLGPVNQARPEAALAQPLKPSESITGTGTRPRGEIGRTGRSLVRLLGVDTKTQVSTTMVSGGFG